MRKKDTETSSEAVCQKPLRKHTWLLSLRLHDADVHGKRNCILLTRTAALRARKNGAGACIGRDMKLACCTSVDKLEAATAKQRLL